MESVESKRSSVVVKEPIAHTICAVCSKPYNDPRILPCLHSFCQQCIHHEIEKSDSQQVFKCPTCARSMGIPVGGANEFPQNLHLGFEVEVAGYMSKIASNNEVCCDECIDGHNGPAEVFCCTCCQFLCKPCHHHHKGSRRLSKHNMVVLGQEGAKQLQTATIIKPQECYCSYHEEHTLKFYCETCKMPVCRDCTTVVHKDHGVTELSIVAKTHRSEIEEVLANARGIVSMLTGAIDGNGKVIEQVEISKMNALLVITQAFEQLQQTLDERKRTLLSDLEAASLSKMTALNLQKEAFEKIVEDIGHYTEVASHILQTHTDHEVVALGGLVPTELQATLKRVQTMSFTPNQNSDISVSIQTDGLVAEMSKFGHVAELSPSPSSSTWISTSVAKVGTRFLVKVESKTSEGKGYPRGGVKVKGQMRSNAFGEAVVHGEVEDHGDGTYTITLTPQTAGRHQLVITMDGQHVQNSPHDLDVGANKICYPMSCIHKRIYVVEANYQQVISCSGRPYCVAIHEYQSGNTCLPKVDIYIGSSSNCIDVFDIKTGKLKFTIGKRGRGYGEFDMPCGIFIKEDMLYVADCNNNRIQKLTLEGKYTYTFSVDKPSAVIIDGYNRIIVADSLNNNLCIFTHNGGLLLTIYGCGSDYSSFQHPKGLALDPQGNIYAAAYGSNCIKVFNKEGVYVRMYGSDAKGPTGIAVDDEGYSFVSERDGNCLSVFDPEGNKIHSLQNLYEPSGIALYRTFEQAYGYHNGKWLGDKKKFYKYIAAVANSKADVVYMYKTSIMY